MSPSTKLGVAMAESKPTDAKVKEHDIENSEKMMNVLSIDTAVIKVKDFKLPEGFYSGDMKNGKRHGHGIMKWSNGRVEECCWSEDIKNGLTMRTNKYGFVHWFCSIAAGEKRSISSDSLIFSKLPSQYYPMLSASYKLERKICLVNLANGWTMKVGCNKSGLIEGKGRVENKEGKVVLEGELKNGVIQFGSPLYFIFWAAWFVRYPLWYMLVVSSILFSMHSLLSGAHNRLSHMQVRNSTLFSDGQPGAQYSGQLSYFRRHGQGVMRYFDQSSFSNATLMREYNGSWSQGVMSGPGTLTFSLDCECDQRGDVLSGDWVENRLTHGVYKYVSGDVYTGDLANFKRHGTGTMRYVDGSVYEGQFRRGNREGLGRLVERGDYVCEGEWFNDKFSDAVGCKLVEVIVENVATSVTFQKVGKYGKNVIIFFDRVQIPFVFVLIVVIFIPLLLLFVLI